MKQSKQTTPGLTESYQDLLRADLTDPVQAEAYINAAIEEADGPVLLLALRDVAEAHGMAQVAEQTGLYRESLYRMLSESGNPRFSSLVAILNALGLSLVVRRNAA